MSLKQALDDACAVEEKIYLLFPAGRRITVYAQQVRALTLVEALRETEWMPKVQSVAIVGGGISGITAAMAFYVANLRETLTVTIFESRDRLVPLQASCRDKVLAPHIIDWPQPGADEPHADLPVLETGARLARKRQESLLKLQHPVIHRFVWSWLAAAPREAMLIRPEWDQFYLIRFCAYRAVASFQTVEIHPDRPLLVGVGTC